MKHHAHLVKGKLVSVQQMDGDMGPGTFPTITLHHDLFSSGEIVPMTLPISQALIDALKLPDKVGTVLLCSTIMDADNRIRDTMTICYP